MDPSPLSPSSIRGFTSRADRALADGPPATGEAISRALTSRPSTGGGALGNNRACVDEFSFTPVPAAAAADPNAGLKAALQKKIQKLKKKIKDARKKGRRDKARRLTKKLKKLLKKLRAL